MTTEGATSDLSDNVQALVELISPLVTLVEEFTWSGRDEDQFWELLRRSSMVRQYEALRTIPSMINGGTGHFGVTFLRPAYEELIWIEYLTQHPEVARESVVLLALHEVGDSLSAQNEFLGVKSMNTIGFTQRFVKRYLASARANDARLRAIGRELGWRQGQTNPSTAYVARHVNRKKEYKFLYHATSRYVHFSPHELFRRVWGRKGKVNITSNTFSKYWSSFAIYWGFSIFIQTLSAAELECFSETEFDVEILQRIEKLHPVEILTSVVLESWPQDLVHRLSQSRHSGNLILNTKHWVAPAHGESFVWIGALGAR